MREVTHTSVLTPRLRRLAAAFGLSLRGASRAWSDAGDARGGESIREVAGLIGAGAVVFVTGASGAGKSSLLRGLGIELGRRGVRVIRGTVDAWATNRRDVRLPMGRCRESIADRLARASGRGDAGALDALASAGLAEATLLARRVHELSEGERARFGIARAIAACERPGRGKLGSKGTCLIVDEFASTLDKTTALGVATSVARWARSRGVACVLASARDDVVEGLRPDVLVYVELGGKADVLRAECRAGIDLRGTIPP